MNGWEELNEALSIYLTKLHIHSILSLSLQTHKATALQATHIVSKNL